MEQPQIVKSKKTTIEEKSWLEYIRQEQQASANRLEDAAKFMASMISISLTMFLALGKSAFVNYQSSPSIQLAVLLWLLALLMSFFVLFPWRYSYSGESVQSIKAMHRRVVRVKRLLLIGSLVLFLSALSILGFRFFA